MRLVYFTILLCLPHCDTQQDAENKDDHDVMKVKLKYLDATVLRRGVGKVRIVRGELQHADKCGWECSTRKNAFVTELEMSARTESKRMTNHNTPNFHEWTWPTTAQLFLDCHF
jgi:hypothetical protein